MIYHILFVVLIIGADCHLSYTLRFLTSNVQENGIISDYYSTAYDNT
jgi:hypothetical protein